MTSITRLTPPSSLMADSVAGRICAGIAEFSSEHIGMGKDRAKGVLDGLAMGAIKQAPGITHSHERKAVLRDFESAYRQFYTSAGLQQLLKNKYLPYYAKLQAIYATAGEGGAYERRIGFGD